MYFCWSNLLEEFLRFINLMLSFESYIIFIVIMSEQPDGFLQMGASYNFDRSKNSAYKSQTIQPPGFHQWTKDNLYKSSYAHFHSKVPPLLARIQQTPKAAPFPGTEVTSLRSRQKTSTRRDTPLWPRKVSTEKN